MLGPVLRHKFPFWRLPPPWLRPKRRPPVPGFCLARLPQLWNESRNLRMLYEGLPPRLPTTVMLLLSELSFSI